MAITDTRGAAPTAAAMTCAALCAAADAALARLSFECACFLAERAVACDPRSLAAASILARTHLLAGDPLAAINSLEAVSPAAFAAIGIIADTPADPSRTDRHPRSKKPPLAPPTQNPSSPSIPSPSLPSDPLGLQEAASVAYLLATACADLARFLEAESILRSLITNIMPKLLPAQPCLPVPRLGSVPPVDWASVHCLLGSVCRRAGRFNQAEAAFTAALELDPLNWTAFRNLCELVPQSARSFTDSSRILSHLQSIPAISVHEPKPLDPKTLDLVPPTTKQRARPPPPSSSHAAPEHAPDRTTTSSTAPSTESAASRKQSDQLQSRRLRTRAPNSRLESSTAPSTHAPSTASASAATAHTHHHASSVAISSSSSTTTASTTAASTTVIAATAAPAAQKPPIGITRKRLRDGHPAAQRTHVSEHSNEPSHQQPPSHTKPASTTFVSAETAAYIAEMLSHIYCGYLELQLYNCSIALRWLELLPAEHHHTSFVLGLVARAHFESNNFVEAERYFKLVRELDPVRIEGMDIYGTCLWQLKKRVELSYLGKKLEKTHRLAPETWCTIGNFFSVCKEHDQAIRAFKRATQLGPEFEYAHTLLGHEYMANEDLDRATACFRTALRLNPRHYNALYGLAQICVKQEKPQLAEFYFNKAIDVNQGNSRVFSLLANLIQKLPDRHEDALIYYEHAENLSINKSLSKTSRAQMLCELGRHHEALEVIESMSQGKDDKTVHTLLGKIYLGLGMLREALMAFTMAQACYGSKPSNAVKDEIDKIQMKLSEESAANQLPHAEL